MVQKARVQAEDWFPLKRPQEMSFEAFMNILDLVRAS